MSWITTIKPIYRYGLFLIASLLLVYGLVLYDSARYNHGYNTAKLEAMEVYTLEQSELKRLFKLDVERLTEELNDSKQLTISHRDKAIALQLTLNQQMSSVEVVREIEVIPNDCSDIPSYGRVLHNIIGQPPTIHSPE